MFAKIIAAFAALIAYLTGKRAGEAAVHEADQTAALQQEVKIDAAVSHADAAAPRSPAALAGSVRRGDSF